MINCILINCNRFDVKSGRIRYSIRNSGQFSVRHDIVYIRGRPGDLKSKFGTAPKNSERMVTLKLYRIVFTVRRYALHGLCDRNSVRLSVRLSVTLVDCVHMVRPTIMIRISHSV